MRHRSIGGRGLPRLLSLIWARGSQILSVTRLKPFDTSTPEGRSNERYRRVALTTLASTLAKGVQIMTLLISVPLTLGYLGTERYGLWMTIGSIITMLRFADLGMGNGLLNAVSEAYGKDDREAAKTYVSSAFFMLTSIAFLLAVTFGLIYPYVPWRRVFNVSSPRALAEAGPAMVAFVGCFLVSMPLGVVQRVRMGYQHGFINSLWQGMGSLLALAGVLIAIYLRAGLPWLVLAIAGGPIMATVMNGVVLFGFRRRRLRPRWSSVSAHAGRKILRLGILFFVLQTAITIAFASDNIVAAQILGAQAVAQYSVPRRLFNIAPMMLSIILAPLWPAYGESIARGDLRWVRRTLARSLGMVLLITVPASVVLVIFGAWLIDLWVGPQISPSFSLLLGLGVWMVMQAAGNAVGTFLNGANIIGFQAACASLMAIGVLIAKMLLASTIGLPGIIWGTVIGYAVFTAMPISIYLVKLLSTMQPPTTATGLDSVMQRHRS